MRISEARSVLAYLITMFNDYLLYKMISSQSTTQPQMIRAHSDKLSEIPNNRRPDSLQEVVLWGTEISNIDHCLREFLDQFYTETDAQVRESMLDPEPSLVDKIETNAYLAAVAEHLSWQNHLTPPPWVDKPERFLRYPHFPGQMDSLRATLLVQSPNAFRRRMIFVEFDPLYRPRRDFVGIGNDRKASVPPRRIPVFDDEPISIYITDKR